MTPAVVASLVSLGSKLAGAIFGPTELDVIKQEISAGNVVAWWRLKAMITPLDAGNIVKYYGTNGSMLVALIGNRYQLTDTERAALVTAAGIQAAQPKYWPPFGTQFVGLGTIREYADTGVADLMEAKSRDTLNATNPIPAPAALPLTPNTALAPAVAPVRASGCFSILVAAIGIGGALLIF